MRKFTKPLKVKIHPTEIQKAKSFAEEVVHTVNYKDSHQSNLKKIEDDHFVSKIGEEAVRKAFEYLGQEVQGPDYIIYKKKDKSWDEDLYIVSKTAPSEKVGLAVKTQKQSAATKYGLSWTFQHSKRRKDPILNKAENWVCFVLYQDSATEAHCIVFPPFQIKELTFKAPKLKHLKDKKKVVYAEDLLKD